MDSNEIKTVDEPDIVLMDKDETCKFFGGPKRPIHPATLDRCVKKGIYPAPVRVSPNSVRWIKGECEAARTALIAARDQAAA